MSVDVSTTLGDLVTADASLWEEMELDLHEHLHEENNSLFPRVIALEQRLAGR